MLLCPTLFTNLAGAYFGGLLGASACFLASRRLFKGYGERIAKKYPGLGSVLRAVEGGGLGFLIVVRVAPYPFSLMNVLLSTTRISFLTFFIATAISLLKIALHVYIGSTVHDLADLERTGGHPAKIAGMVGGFIVSVAVFIYLAIVVRRKVGERTAEQDEPDVEADIEEDSVRSSSPMSSVSPSSFAPRSSLPAATPGLSRSGVRGVSTDGWSVASEADGEDEIVELSGNGDVGEALLGGRSGSGAVGAGRAGGSGVVAGLVGAVKSAISGGTTGYRRTDGGGGDKS
ncbi:hypothetical protein HDU93_003542 [Gonapodya sp. JEL0774]|nr:hypothetical protein HDU93_003542 [Gonapodya sp. JEL0774]